MFGLFNIILPIFGLIGLGFGAGALRLIDPRGDEVLSQFVNVFGLPILIFRSIAEASPPQVQPWGYWGAYFAAAAAAWAATTMLSRLLFRTGHEESVVAGFAAGQSNTVFVGIPLILSVYGNAGVVPLFLLVAIHLPIMMTAAAIAMESRGGIDVAALIKKLLLNPIVHGLAAGVLWHLFGWHLEGGLKTLADEISAATIPCALFAMGLALRRFGIKAGFGLVTLVAVFKLLVHPGLVYLLALHVFSMPPVWAGVAVLFAAMPSGINAYLLASQYKAGHAIASSAVALSTALAPLSVALWLWALQIKVT
ncbi:MAG: AEC family transporter [Methylovirgula sp.]